MSRPIDLIVVEPNFTGHRMNYCRLVVDRAIARGYSVALATTSDAINSDEFRMRFPDRAEPELIDLGLLPDIRVRGYFGWLTEEIKRILRDHESARLILLEGDKLAIRLAIAPFAIARRGSILVLREPRFEGRFRERIVAVAKYASMKVLASRKFNPVLLGSAAVGQPQRHGSFRAAPDPISYSATAESIRAFMAGARMSSQLEWVGLVGRITARKNVPLVLDAVGASGRPALGVLIAGTIDEHERHAVTAAVQHAEETGIRVVWIERLLTDTELDSAVAAVDCIVLAHSAEGPSGMMGKAIAAGTPVLAAGAESLRIDIERSGGGTWVPLDSIALAGAIRESDWGAKAPGIALNPEEFGNVLIDAAIR